MTEKNEYRTAMVICGGQLAMSEPAGSDLTTAAVACYRREADYNHDYLGSPCRVALVAPDGHVVARDKWLYVARTAIELDDFEPGD